MLCCLLGLSMDGVMSKLCAEISFHQLDSLFCHVLLAVAVTFSEGLC